MSSVRNGELLLTEREKINLLNNLTHPNLEAIKKRDSFIGDITVKKKENGKIVFNIPDFDILFSSENIVNYNLKKGSNMLRIASYILSNENNNMMYSVESETGPNLASLYSKRLNDYYCEKSTDSEKIIRTNYEMKNGSHESKNDLNSFNNSNAA